MRTLHRLALVTAFLAVCTPDAWAGLPSGTVSPSSRTVAMNAPAPLFLNWRLARNGAAGSVTVQSAEAVVRLGNSNGPIIHTISKSLSQTKTVTLNIDFFTFSESIALPRSVVQRAAKAGTGLVLQRAFTDDNFTTTLTKEVAISVTNSSNADFALTRMDLSFSNGSNSCVAKPGERLTAVATVMTTGSGLLRGAWQIREGGSFSTYRTLRTVQQPVAAGSKTTIESPALPASGEKQIDVRLVIESPTPAFEEPTLTCGIGGNVIILKTSRDTSRDAEVLSPTPNSPLGAKTAIRWNAVKGAKAYRIEILPDTDSAPITAQVVKPDKSTATLSPLTLDKLDAKNRYTIRVVAE